MDVAVKAKVFHGQNTFGKWERKNDREPLSKELERREEEFMNLGDWSLDCYVKAFKSYSWQKKAISLFYFI